VLVGAQSRKREGVKYRYIEEKRREWRFGLWKMEMLWPLEESGEVLKEL
jgi:hypothetical protein